jgi:hypothetical protein
MIEDFADSPHQGFGSKGLLQEGSAGGENSVLDDRFIAIAGHVQHPHCGAHGGKSSYQLAAAHLGEHDVGEQEMNGSGIALAEQQGILSVLGFENGMPVPLEKLASEPADALFILDQEDGLRAA